MTSSRVGDYVVLASAVAGIALIATAARTVQFVTDFDLSGSALGVVVGGWFGQASTALAMLCSVLIVRILVASSRSDQAFDPPSAATAGETFEPPFPTAT